MRLLFSCLAFFSLWLTPSQAQVPSKEELNQLYEAKDKGALKGTFNVTGSNSAGWYWSSRDYYGSSAWAQRFSDGVQNDYYGKLFDSSLRCVR